jgi:hypothetical protein
MTANAKTRYTKDGSRKLKQGGKTSRKSAKESGREKLRIKKEEAGKRGREAAKVLNEQLKIKEDTKNETLRNSIKEGERDFGFDSEEFIQDYHRSLTAHDIKFHKDLLQGKEFDISETTPLSQFLNRWQPQGLYEDNPTGKEMRRLKQSYDKLNKEMNKQKTEEHLKWKYGEWRGRRRLGELQI